jgi:hypothetical protein
MRRPQVRDYHRESCGYDPHKCRQAEIQWKVKMKDESGEGASWKDVR